MRRAGEQGAADAFAANVLPVVRQMQATGLTGPCSLAATLNDCGVGGGAIWLAVKQDHSLCRQPIASQRSGSTRCDSEDAYAATGRFGLERQSWQARSTWPRHRRRCVFWWSWRSEVLEPVLTERFAGPRTKPPRFDAIERDLVVATVVELRSALMRHMVRKAEADALLDTCSIDRGGKFITCPAHRQHPGHGVFVDGLPGTRRERSNRRYDADGRMCRRCRCYAGYQPCGKTSLPAFWRRRDRGRARCDHVR
jgi:hypothetical protein